MPQYELLFSHDMDTGSEFLNQGDAFRYRGEVWRVDHLEPADRESHPRAYLSLWPNQLPFPAIVKGESER